MALFPLPGGGGIKISDWTLKGAMKKGPLIGITTGKGGISIAMIDHPNLDHLTTAERKEYFDLFKIIQDVTGIEYIISNGDVMMNPEVAPFRERIRHLIMINAERRDEADVKGSF